MNKDQLNNLSKPIPLEKILACFSPDPNNDNFYLCAFDIIEGLGGSETAIRRDLKKLYQQGKLDFTEAIEGKATRKYYFLKEPQIKEWRSTCCNAEVKLSDPAPDFIGDDPKTMTVGTCSYICEKCEKECDVK